MIPNNILDNTHNNTIINDYLTSHWSRQNFEMAQVEYGIYTRPSLSLCRSCNAFDDTPLSPPPIGWTLLLSETHGIEVD